MINNCVFHTLMEASLCQHKIGRLKTQLTSIADGREGFNEIFPGLEACNFGWRNKTRGCTAVNVCWVLYRLITSRTCCWWEDGETRIKMRGRGGGGSIYLVGGYQAGYTVRPRLSERLVTHEMCSDWKTCGILNHYKQKMIEEVTMCSDCETYGLNEHGLTRSEYILGVG